MSKQDPNATKQWQRALEMLREGPASALAFWSECGIYRASDAIYTLREYGYDVRTDMVDFVTTRGYKVRFARYTLVSEDRANARRFLREAGISEFGKAAPA